MHHAGDIKQVIDRWIQIPNSFSAQYPGIIMFLTSLLVCTIIVTFIAVYGMAIIYAERKIVAHIQDRLGPMRVGWHGILQSLVDGVKLALKEDLIPATGDGLLFKLAPFIVFCASFAAFVVIPFGANWMMLADLNIGVLYVVSLGSAVLIGTVMAGWASNNKWALFGAMRSVAMVVSYEIPAALSILPVVVLTGSLSLRTIGSAQAGSMWNWFLFQYPPFLFLAYIVLYIATLAEVNRTPFDLAEAESELVAGYHTEYSGIRWSFFFLAEYADMLLVSMMGVSLYLGAWHAPRMFAFTTSVGGFLESSIWWIAILCVAAYLAYLWRFYARIGETGLIVAQIAILSIIGLGLWVPVVRGLTVFLLKSLFLIFVMIWIRSTLPRFRIDQLMNLCWKFLMPLAFVNLLSVVLWSYLKT